MHNQSPQERVRLLYQMLFEMATGNLTFRMQKLHDDELDELSVMLNTIASRMQSAILSASLLNPVYTYQSIAQTTFVLSGQLTIKSFSSTALSMLGFEEPQLFEKPFSALLSGNTIVQWQSIAEELSRDTKYHNTVQLIFEDANQKLIPSFCTISKLLYSDKIFISSITTILQDFILNKPQPQPAAPKVSDVELMQKVYEYILNNLEAPLPSSKTISKIFGINEFRLKDSFRHSFNTSIHQFYNKERLKKAHLLIQQTNEPIKNIAFSCGFNTYLNFYKAFKKRFHYAPTNLKRAH